ncbi:MAG: hypothetical protein AB1757_01955 [Acidobacteriota bacterium]
MEEKLLIEVPESKRKEFEKLLDELIKGIKHTVKQGEIQAAKFAEHQTEFQRIMREIEARRKNVEKAA